MKAYLGILLVFCLGLAIFISSCNEEPLINEELPNQEGTTVIFGNSTKRSGTNDVALYSGGSWTYYLSTGDVTTVYDSINGSTDPNMSFDTWTVDDPAPTNDTVKAYLVMRGDNGIDTSINVNFELVKDVSLGSTLYHINDNDPIYSPFRANKCKGNNCSHCKVKRKGFLGLGGFDGCECQGGGWDENKPSGCNHEVEEKGLLGWIIDTLFG